jgi:membrane protein insertase Oxa1/YidC/SpoIIIJ
VLSAGSQVLQMWIGQKSNDSVVTNENGIQDKEAAKNSQSAQSGKMMMWMMPLMSLWIGFTVSAGLSLYWFIGGVYSMISDTIMTKHFRKVYDAEDAERLKKHLEEERLEAEKERIRAERRAANPDGITDNTSKKKMQKKLEAEKEAAKAAAAKEYAAKKGIQDAEAAKNSQAAQSTQMMMWMMPLMSLWIGFTVSASLSLYWFIGGVVRMAIDPIMTNHYRKIYDAEDAIRLQKHLEEERLEAEKERIRAERRAANPDGITTNTSKKKLNRQQRELEAAEKAAAAKEFAAKRGIAVDEEEDSCMSGIPSRPYCKGRNYDPNRYNN